MTWTKGDVEPHLGTRCAPPCHNHGVKVVGQGRSSKRIQETMNVRGWVSKHMIRSSEVGYETFPQGHPLHVCV